MATNPCISLFITLAAAAWTPLAISASPGDPAGSKGAHAPERPEEPAAAPQQSAELDAQIAHLRAIRERLSRASTDEERRMLLAERATVMRDAMTTMQKTGGMPGPGGMRNAGRAGTPRGPGAGMCYDPTGQHVALMQEMMAAMADGQGAGPGMGPGPGGQGMHRGMMAR
ncbi:hypothetical protein LMG23992_00673 [Cupriavidus laharis]|uniref:Uncharacterized protein n=1 Tax=Cupriavidus laharis TaxID=151654 RepID=A0ABM8WFD8_9BURK|nr:hypothetical protein [Cupriavidus laharis]CAG9166042.1 hypothetical protein LMG23992_00673 [Cupriavidus laharis]